MAEMHNALGATLKTTGFVEIAVVATQCSAQRCDARSATLARELLWKQTTKRSLGHGLPFGKGTTGDLVEALVAVVQAGNLHNGVTAGAGKVVANVGSTTVSTPSRTTLSRTCRFCHNSGAEL